MDAEHLEIFPQLMPPVLWPRRISLQLKYPEIMQFTPYGKVLQTMDLGKDRLERIMHLYDFRRIATPD